MSSLANQPQKGIIIKLAAIILAIAVYLILTGLPTPEGLAPNAQKAFAFMISAIILWVFEAIPIGISAPFLVMVMGTLGIVSLKEALAGMIITSNMFILAAFVIAIVFVSTGLGNRLSLMMSGIFGSKADRVLLSFMLSTSVVSAVLADIPTAIIFAGVAYPLLQKNDCLPGKSNFGKAVMMGIPIAAAIGGIGTPAGSGINVLAISLLKSSAKVDINFLQWTLIGFPLAILLTFAAWFILVKMVPSEIENVKGLEDIAQRRKELGPLTTNEKKFVVIFGITLILWLTTPWSKFELSMIGIAAATAFFLPGINLITWEEAKGKIGWDAVLLVGATYSIAMAILNLKGSAWLANTVLGGLTSGSGPLVLLTAVVAFGIFSHLIIPTATALLAVAIPVISLMAINMGINPALLAIPIGFTASCVFLLPLDPIPLTTFNYGYWKFWDMMKPGFVIALVWLVLNVIFMYGASVIGII